MKNVKPIWSVRKEISARSIIVRWSWRNRSVRLEWNDFSASPLTNLVIGWYEKWMLHRKDGPASIFGSGVSREELLWISEQADPEILDDWLRKNETTLRWSLFDSYIHEEQGLLTYQFPDITAEFIRLQIELGPRLDEPDDDYTVFWLRVARVLRVMDKGLRKLEKSIKLLI